MRKLAVSLAATVLATALVFLLAAQWLAERSIRAEHEAAARRTAELFEASLKNAMLKRDLLGLEEILARLGEVPGVREAMILNTAGEIRFAARRNRIGERPPEALSGLCLAQGCASSPPRYDWIAGQDGGGVRITYPVRNEARCVQCHGEPQARPVNGVLLIEFSAVAGEAEAQRHAGVLVAAGITAMAFLMAMVAWLLNRTVLRPQRLLSQTAEAYARGDWSARASLPGRDELAQLGGQLERMAARIDAMIGELENQRAFLQRLVDAAPDPMLVIGDDFRIVLANAAYARLVGRGDAASRQCYEVSRGRSEPCAATLVTCPVVELRGQSAPVRCVMQFARGNGATTDVEIDAAPLVSPDGQRMVVEVIRSLEEKVRFSQEQRLSAVGLLANGVAHEIHNPLASIRIALQASLRGLRSGSMPREELTDYLVLVDREIDRCVAITQRLLRISQPPGDGFDAVAVRPAVEETLALLAQEARARQIEVDVAIEPPEVRVRADDGELRMVVLNLVQNAFHAMPEGGRLAIRGTAREGGFVLAFEDNGVGIESADLPMIFLPFFSRRADSRRGTGLGLAICRGIVERCGGRIEVDSEPGKGSVFRVILPHDDEPQR
jgi:signal transduction histidine kinase/HAMP domain-containing protein